MEKENTSFLDKVAFIDTKLAVTLVSVSVLLSLFTMPLVISLAMAVA